MPGPLGLPRRYSVAFLLGGAVALLFLPVSGVPPRSVPTQGPRSVEALIQDGAEGEPRELVLAAAMGMEGFSGSAMADEEGPAAVRVLLLDADRDGDVVLFDHDDHAERLGGDRSCETCHHLTKPLDENTSCFECHTDMYEPRSTFDHDLHALSLGENEGCVECHDGTAEVKSYETITECSECHRNEIAERAFVDQPPARWEDAVGYMDAMHSLCVECHEREAASGREEIPENLNRCMTCHDVDWRDDVRRLAPQRSASQRVATDPGSGGRVGGGGRE
jgi:hypothetical protein